MKLTLIILIILCLNNTILSQRRYFDFSKGMYSNNENTPPSKEISQNDKSIEVVYQIEDASIDISVKDSFKTQQIRIKNFTLMDEKGNPELPCYNDIISVPQSDGIRLKILEANYKEFDNFNIAPSKGPNYIYKNDKDKTIKQNDAVYSANKFFPENIAKVALIQRFREVPLAYVQIRPIQYNPKTKKIRCYSKIKYQLEFTNPKKVTTNKNSNSYKILQNVISNPNITSKELSSLKSATLTQSSTPAYYIIITTDEFLLAAKEFAYWKERMGYNCEIISQSSWTSSQVKSEIHTRYNALDPKPEYFLIIGDHDDVPGEEYYLWSLYLYATDLYYACMDGTGDFVPDMAHGRVSVSTLEEAYIVLRKITNYERYSVISSSFYNTTTHCTQFQDSGLDGYEDAATYFTLVSENIRDYLILQNKTANRIYYAKNNVYPRYYDINLGGEAITSALRKDIAPYYSWSGSASDIVSAINAGTFCIFHFDHGQYTEWGHPNFTTNDISNLTNGDKLPVVFSMNCRSGGFLQPECFAEKFIRQSNGGAVGVIAASEYSTSGSNLSLLFGMVDAIWSSPGLLPAWSNPNDIVFATHTDIYKMGEVLNQGLLRIPTYGLNSYQEYCTLYHYFGDPSMEIYTSQPTIFSSASVNQNGSTVSVSTGGEGGSNICLMSVLDNGNTFHEYYPNTPSATFYNINFPYYVTITKHNKIAYTLNPGNLLIENKTFSTDAYVECASLSAGYSVDPNHLPDGNVIISSGSSVTFDATGDVLLDNGFEVELGATFEVK